MGKKASSTPTEKFNSAIDALLTRVCVEGGFCGDPDHAPFDRARTAWTADDFAVDVLRAEGLDPIVIEGFGPSRAEYFVWIRAQFVAAFGEAVSIVDFQG